MSVPSSLEKIFFSYILENPKFFKKTADYYFSNEHIKFVFQTVKKHYVILKNQVVPSPKKIVELVRLEDRSKEIISDEVLKSVLQTDVGQYQQSIDDDWLDKTFKAWLIQNSVRDRIMQSIEKLRELDPQTINYENTVKVFRTIKDLVGDTSLITYNDDDLGSDFDDPTSHEQNAVLNTISTGWTNLNDLLNGGWDRKTLNILMAPSGVGKSLWLCNIAVNAANAGKNVAYVSLEMSEKKIMKRLGSSRLKIPIYEYDELSKDTHFIKQKLAELHHGYSAGSDMFENRVGKIFAKEYPAGTAG
ncbi:MAG: DnaB-like helicase C-terminal domain-containing protein, partial [Candidatus Heimdallarchaeota archaeon]